MRYRLQGNERNKNFGNNTTMQPEYNMHLPPKKTCKDIHSETVLPDITMQSMINYFHPFEIDFGTKPQDLYKDIFVICTLR